MNQNIGLTIKIKRNSLLYTPISTMPRSFSVFAGRIMERIVFIGIDFKISYVKREDM